MKPYFFWKDMASFLKRIYQRNNNEGHLRFFTPKVLYLILATTDHTLELAQVRNSDESGDESDWTDDLVSNIS